MPEQLQQILDKILEWWKKFNTKQKALLASIVAVILLSLVILTVRLPATAPFPKKIAAPFVIFRRTAVFLHWQAGVSLDGSQNGST